MTPEIIARQHQFRDGFRLVDYGEVGLPVFRLTLEAVTMAYRSLPTIQEFIMRCLSLGERSEPDIARMLGLKTELVQGAMNGLVEDSYAVREAAAGGVYAFRLTDDGVERLRKERVECPQEEMLVIDYDGIRRTTLRLAGESVLRPAEVQMLGAVQIRPYPAEPPPVSELSISDVSKVIRRQRGEDFQRTVLALKRVVRRTNVFREAVALVFANETSQEVQVAFVLDGKISEPHERAFAENGGPRKMGFVKSVATAETRKRLEKLVGRAMIRRFPDPAALDAARTEEAEALGHVSALAGAASRVTGRSRHTDPAVAAFGAAQERVQKARYALNLFEARPLAPYEQMELLDESFREARTSLLVTTGGVQGSLLNAVRLRALDQALSSRVAVEVETLQAAVQAPRAGDQFDPLFELSRRADRGGLILRRGTPREFHFLVQDEELAVISNRPFFGDVTRRTGFVCVDGLVTRRPELVAEVRRLALAQTEGPRRAR